MPPVAPNYEVRTLLAVLRRRKWLAVMAVCGCLAASLAMSVMQGKTYMASSTVLLSAQQEALQPGTALSDPNALQSQISTQAEIVTSTSVVARVNKVLGRDAASVSEVYASGVDPTRVLAMTVTASSSAEAAKGANA